jgi:hypothetical protein
VVLVEGSLQGRGRGAQAWLCGAVVLAWAFSTQWPGSWCCWKFTHLKAHPHTRAHARTHFDVLESALKRVDEWGQPTGVATALLPGSNPCSLLASRQRSVRASQGSICQVEQVGEGWVPIQQLLQIAGGTVELGGRYRSVRDSLQRVLQALKRHGRVCLGKQSPGGHPLPAGAPPQSQVPGPPGWQTGRLAAPIGAGRSIRRTSSSLRRELHQERGCCCCGIVSQAAAQETKRSRSMSDFEELLASFK